jgi:hypothetical protein
MGYQYPPGPLKAHWCQGLGPIGARWKPAGLRAASGAGPWPFWAFRPVKPQPGSHAGAAPGRWRLGRAPGPSCTACMGHMGPFFQVAPGAQACAALARASPKLAGHQLRLQLGVAAAMQGPQWWRASPPRGTCQWGTQPWAHTQKCAPKRAPKRAPNFLWISGRRAPRTTNTFGAPCHRAPRNFGGFSGRKCPRI